MAEAPLRERGLSRSSLPAGLLEPRLLLTATAAVLADGLFLLLTVPEAFARWIREDGFVEWVTFGFLLGSAVYACRCLWRHWDDLGRGGKISWAIAASMFLFGAMEEISWGQRIFGIESPAWFVIHNAQHETNLHNLVVGGVKLNRLVFGKLLTVGIVLYLVVLPLLYRSRTAVRTVADRWAIPIPRAYQTLYFAAVVLLLALVGRRSSRMGELREFAGSIVFFLVLRHPVNGALLPFTKRPRIRLAPVGEPGMP